ncbi:hypothetical protein Ga0080559_TMP5049 (plasmid) [Salipiger profundus]|uniref:Uncharacterized protein n=1 Tax=Salipiger profundus TaxID=1229727 RepID=A0A1U7DE88_9RHOB|nr:hypothetical protein Ga0080559_TMP5049 [Salipiger profundus]
MSRHTNLGVQLFDLLLVDLRGFFAASLEHAGRAFQKRPFPAVDHGGVDAELARKLSHCALTL